MIKNFKHSARTHPDRTVRGVILFHGMSLHESLFLIKKKPLSKMVAKIQLHNPHMYMYGCCMVDTIGQHISIHIDVGAC